MKNNCGDNRSQLFFTVYCIFFIGGDFMEIKNKHYIDWCNLKFCFACKGDLHSNKLCVSCMNKDNFRAKDDLHEIPYFSESPDSNV